jgi:hypothetical protein
VAVDEAVHVVVAREVEGRDRGAREVRERVVELAREREVVPRGATAIRAGLRGRARVPAEPVERVELLVVELIDVRPGPLLGEGECRRVERSVEPDILRVGVAPRAAAAAVVIPPAGNWSRQ